MKKIEVPKEVMKKFDTGHPKTDKAKAFAYLKLVEEGNKNPSELDLNIHAAMAAMMHWERL